MAKGLRRMLGSQSPSRHSGQCAKPAKAARDFNDVELQNIDLVPYSRFDFRPVPLYRIDADFVREPIS
jgi:hypothetical protein